MSQPVCAIIGVGEGNGAHIARKFSAQGYRVALMARNLDNLNALAEGIDHATAYPLDATQPEAITDVLARVASDLGPIQTLVYNGGAAVFGNVENIELDAFEQSWRLNVLGCLTAAKQVIPGMKAAGGGNIVVIGATASVKGGANFAAFSSAKGAQRNLAQSMARHLAQDGIHVSHVVIDGVIDIQRSRKLFGDKPDNFFMQASDIADSVYHLCQQQPSAWTFELDLRPSSEKW